MAFYKDAKPRKMSKEDHLRTMSKWSEEGTRYKKSNSNRYGEQDSARGAKPYGEHAERSYGKKPYGERDYNKKTFSDRGEKNFGSKSYGEHNSRSAYGKKPFGDKPSFRADVRKAAPVPRPSFDRDDDDFNEEHFAPVHKQPVRENRFDKERRAPRFEESIVRPEPENLLSGRNPIREALKAGRDIEKLLVAKGELSGSAREIVQMAKEMHIPVQVVERTRLDEITHNHQGMLAFASAYRYSDVESMLEEAKEKGEDPFLVVLDGVTDPMNLGAIIRTAACVGAHGVIVPERRAAGLTPTAVKASAGAIEVVKVARVTNLNRTLDQLKEKGLWLYAADMKGTDFRKVDFSGPCALIVGGEGDGVSRLVSEKSDHIVSLPMSGKLDSLNASVAAGILMYAVQGSR